MTGYRSSRISKRLVACLASALLLPLAIQVSLAAVEFSTDQWQRDVAYLADPALEGRALGSKGAAKAASYIEERFREIGLRPAPVLGARVRFPVSLDIEMDESEGHNLFRLAGPASSADLQLRKDYQPLPFSGNANLENRQLVFAGYAIADPERDYDDFAGLDIRGKIVIALRREPQEREGSSRFRGLDFTPNASFAAKARAVANRGGAGLVLVSNRLPAESADELPPFSPSAGPGKLPIPVLMARAQAIAPFFTEQGMELASLVRMIDREGKPQSFAFPTGYRATLRVTLKGKAAEGFDVLGWKPGQTEEYIIVGAHYDHIGFGKRFAMDPAAKGTLHPGADDNASGVASMLELARTVAQGPALRRGVLFVAFAGEEHGLFGSAALLERTAELPGRLTGMINFDMVGRLRNNELFIAGLESVPGLSAPVEAAAQSAGLTLRRISEYPYSMSDHGTFLDAGVPSLLFFTGLHEEYHTARDTPDTLNPAGAHTLLDVAYETVLAMADRPGEIEYVPGKDPLIERNMREIVAPSNPLQQE